jgi:hypothetical protein
MIRRFAALVIVLMICVTVAGCGGSSGASRGEVESMIRSQLPASVKRNTGEAVFVNKVTCTKKSKNQFDCIASVTGTNGVGGLQSVDIPVSATCDEQNCTWRSEG